MSCEDNTTGVSVPQGTIAYQPEGCHVCSKKYLLQCNKVELLPKNTSDTSLSFLASASAHDTVVAKCSGGTWVPNTKLPNLGGWICHND